MENQTITCPKCKTVITLSEAITHEISDSVLKDEREKFEREIEKAKQSAITEANEAAAKKLEQDMKTNKEDIDAERNASKRLREEQGILLKQLREEKQARENAELEAQKKIAAEESKIREEATRVADEKYRLKTAEHDKQLADTKKALEAAKRKADQGSQQNQGEVLELDLENRLKAQFPLDEIVEVKKGQRGADIKQIVHNQTGIPCGILLWETKNGKWQPAWVAKFKQDIREANANIGVIVSAETTSEVGEMKNIESNVWVVSPRFSTHLAVALRAIILQVDSANKMNAGKDAKMEALYQFLIGPEFRHRVEAIVENFSTLQDEVEKEKRAFALKWARQEKAIRGVIDNTVGMYGDLQGVTNQALPTIKNLELPDAEDRSSI